MNDKLQMTIELTQSRIQYSISELQEHAENLMRHAREAEEFVRATKAGEPFSTSWIGFAQDNLAKTALRLERLDGLRETLRALEYLTRDAAGDIIQNLEETND